MDWHRLNKLPHFILWSLIFSGLIENRLPGTGINLCKDEQFEELRIHGSGRLFGVVRLKNALNIMRCSREQGVMVLLTKRW